MSKLSPEATLLDIIKSNRTVTEEEVWPLFDELQPVTIEEIIGEWSGAPVETGHMTSKWCKDVDFAGKRFNAPNDVEPVLVFDKDGNRGFYGPNGMARLRKVEYRGVVTATLIYDSAPIMDYFRKLDADTIISAADNKNKPNGTFFFYLVRGAKQKGELP